MLGRVSGGREWHDIEIACVCECESECSPRTINTEQGQHFAVAMYIYMELPGDAMCKLWKLA